MKDTGIDSWFHGRLKEAAKTIKECYIIDCPHKPIRAHSITENRLLSKIAKDGQVIYLNTEKLISQASPHLTPTGKGQATTFPGFCSNHDTIFRPIDNFDYQPGNIKQEFLFALRASARELSIRRSMVEALEHLLHDYKEGRASGIALPQEYVASEEELMAIKASLAPLHIIVKELEQERRAFNKNYLNENFWKLKTLTFEFEGEYPLVAVATFNMEEDLEGESINNRPIERARVKPTYLTLFPQNGKTYALLSWKRRDDSVLSQVMASIYNKSTPEQQIILSHLLTFYIENFAVNPDYWENMPHELKKKYFRHESLSRSEDRLPLIYDSWYNLFYKPD